MLLVVVARVKGNPVFGRGPRQVVLGEVRPVAGRVAVPSTSVISPWNPRWRSSSATQFPAAPAPTMPTECGVAPARARGRTVPGLFSLPRTVTLPPAIETAYASTGLSAGARRASPGAQAEAGVVPGTPNGVADDEALGERPAVVAARRPDGEGLAPAPDEEDGLALDVPETRLSVLEIVEGQARGQVGPFRFARLVAHVHLACASVRTLRVSPIHGVRGAPEGDSSAGEGGLPPLQEAADGGVALEADRQLVGAAGLAVRARPREQVRARRPVGLVVGEARVRRHLLQRGQGGRRRPAAPRRPGRG